MFKLIIISFYILLINFIICDGNNWIKDPEELVIEESNGSTPNGSTQNGSTQNGSSQNDSINASTQISSIGSSSSENPFSDLSISPESTTIATTTNTTEKPLPKQFGCSSLLWVEDSKFCWTRCNTSSTSKFFNTWCFTTNATVDIDKAPKAQCDFDEQCQPQWKCKSSCGMFSPHWDKEEGAPKDETVIKDSLEK